MMGKISLLKLYGLCLCWMLLHPPRTALAQTDPAPRAIAVNGTVLHYIEAGKGAPVVFVHGSFGDYRTWHYQIVPFARRYRVVSYSRRYYYPNSPSDSSSIYSNRLDVEDLAALIKAMDAGAVHLVGHSAGAYIALVVAIRYPELVKDLVLGEPPIWELTAGDSLGRSLMNKAMAEIFMPAVEAFKKDEDYKAAEIFLDGVVGKEHFLTKLPPLDRKIMSDEIAMEKSIFLSKGDPDYRQPFTAADIRNITIPVLLVSGANTPRWLSHLTDRLGMCLQNKERVVLSNTSHGLEFINPNAFNKAVLGFIDKQERKSGGRKYLKTQNHPSNPVHPKK